jgi:LytS/YehU family sensor histidine kinase
MLEGFDPQWVNAGKNNRAVYTSLAPGHYTLLINATNTAGKWGAKIKRLNITIHPPFWKTWWFLLMCAMAFATIVYLVIYYRLKGISNEQKKQLHFERQAMELEAQALRVQMNPHFIFNCLNSIQLFVMQRDYEYAQKSLSVFSYLIRKTLDFSRRNFISLADEIAYLSTYLGLEKMRFENKMEYNLIVDPAIATAELEIPAMLLQPYVENAVKYGMTNADYPIGKLMICFNQIESDMLECLIDDNGIGIARSKEIRTLPTHHQSSGMEISANRAELLNKMYNTGIHIDIIDKSENNPLESGTIVRILIPQL